MDLIQSKKIICSNTGLTFLILISLFSMCHSAIKDQPPAHLSDNHVATMFSPLETNSELEDKHTPCAGNCDSYSKMEVKIVSLLKKEQGEDVTYKINETDDEASRKMEIKVSNTEDEHHWKVKVIIVCTIAASIEIVIVVLILIYWKDIRWSMRKMYCPCDERRIRRRDHEAMEPSGPSPSDSGFHGDDLEQGHQVQTYQTRRREENDQMEEGTVMQTSVV